MSIAFMINGQAPEGFTLPDVAPATPLGVSMFPDPALFQRPADIVPGQKVIARLNTASPLFGQVYGYVAPKNQCILDLDPNSCWVVPPSPTGYGYALQGRTILSDATEIATANMGGAGGHAPRDAGLADVQRYYEDVSTQLARVVYGEDDYGVWAAGAMVPTATWGDAVSMLASATSGDWRWVDELNGWDFLGSCLVNIPGFPMFSRAVAQTRLVRAASAMPLGDKVMIVTMSGSIEPEGEQMGTADCSCKTAAQAVQASGAEAAAPLTEADVDARVQAAVTTAIEANNASWETKLSETLSPINDRLSTVEAISLGVLDGASA